MDECEKFKKDKDKYSFNRANVMKMYKERLLTNAKKSNISINKATLSSRPQESTFSVEQTEQLIGGMQLSDTSSDSKLLDKVIKEVTVDEVKFQ